MNMTEVTLLNRTVSGFTRSSPSDIEAAAWYLVLRDFEYKDAEQAVISHFLGPNKHKFFEVGYILDGVREIRRLTPEKIEEDVRSAKARGFIGDDWPARQLLPADVMERLTAARARFQEDMENLRAIGTGSPVAFEPGRIGKDVPRD